VTADWVREIHALNAQIRQHGEHAEQLAERKREIMRAQREAGLSLSQIAAELGITRARVEKMVNGGAAREIARYAGHATPAETMERYGR
jgi:DNA-directed RNA polymerase specialized sigma subunit